MKLFLLVNLSLLLSVRLAFAACYPGLDCPEDIPRDAPGSYNPPPTQPAPSQPPSVDVPRPPVPQQQAPSQAYEDCSNPYAALLGAMLGLPPANPCTQPATHCCFEDGSAVPLVYPGSIRFGEPCHVQINTLWGVMPVQGLGCRR